MTYELLDGFAHMFKVSLGQLWSSFSYLLWNCHLCRQLALSYLYFPAWTIGLPRMVYKCLWVGPGSHMCYLTITLLCLRIVPVFCTHFCWIYLAFFSLQACDLLRRKVLLSYFRIPGPESTHISVTASHSLDALWKKHAYSCVSSQFYKAESSGVKPLTLQFNKLPLPPGSPSPRLLRMIKFGDHFTREWRGRNS